MTKDLELELQRVDESFLPFNQLAGFGEMLRLLKTVWAEDEDVQNSFDTNVIVAVYRSLAREITRDVLQRPDPEMALREKLVEAAYRFGCYMSLMLSPEPAEDPSGLRNPQLGVTGTLRPYVSDLVKAYESIPNHQLIAVESATPEVADDYILLEYLYWLAEFNVLSKLRRVLDKVSDPRAWEYVALNAACSMWEQTHREAIGLPSPFAPGVGDVPYRGHSKLLQIIRSGVPDPLAAWRTAMEQEEKVSTVP